ncbi:phosphonate C-P lyase system protein PhnH [Thorsellia kenyensis]|uniref:Phosphonate C-P lyase system protein PhnH n=1 Tax=Thorsellia kenyensis TaxID=1549888 RepID=A0ABV6C7M6_9GAMM
MIIQKGFKQLSTDAQVVFKKVLQALSEPGLCIEYDYEGLYWPNLHPTTTGLFLSLCDVDTPIGGDSALLNEEIRKSLAFHTQSPFVNNVSEANFVLFDETVSLDILTLLAKGSALSPENNCTVVIQCSGKKIENRTESPPKLELNLSGPGIPDQRTFAIDNLTLASGIVQYLIKGRPKFPMGLDFIFTTSNTFIGLSRTTKVEVKPCM